MKATLKVHNYKMWKIKLNYEGRAGGVLMMSEWDRKKKNKKKTGAITQNTYSQIIQNIVVRNSAKLMTTKCF